MRHLTLCLLLLLGGCGMDLQDYAGGNPRLTLEEFFNGRLQAAGVFEDRFGRVRRQFTVEIQGNWNAERRELQLTESFLFDDGETDQRLWTITKVAENEYVGTAPGVVGTAIGKGAGNAFRWTYTFDLKVGDGTWRVDFDDWFWLQEGAVLINRATVSKFGVRIGGLAIFFRKQPA